MGEHYRIACRAARPSVGLLHRCLVYPAADLRFLLGLLAIVLRMRSILLCCTLCGIAPAMGLSAALVSAFGSAGAANSPTHDYAPTQQRDAFIAFVLRSGTPCVNNGSGPWSPASKAGKSL